jgi:hypothetical protein
METVTDTQRIELVFPCPGGGETLGAALEAFKRWASEHAGQDLAGLMRQGPAVPFFEADATSRIAAAVRSAAAAPAETTAGERLHRARLLLLMAQDLDRSRRELEAELQRLEAQERRMLEMLKGENEVDAARGEIRPSSVAAARPPLHMLTARLGAWAQLALQAQGFWHQNPETLFLTASMDALSQVTEQTEAEPLMNRHSVTPGSEALRAWLADPQGQPPMTASPSATSTTAPVGLTLFRLPGFEPREWLRRLAGETLAAPCEPGQDSASKGVLVGHVTLG